MRLATGKYIAAAVVAVATVVGCALPLFVRQIKWARRFESFAGGVFLGAGLAHLLHDSFIEISKVSDAPDYPISTSVTAAVFFLLTAVEILSSGSEESLSDESSGFVPQDLPDADRDDPEGVQDATEAPPEESSRLRLFGDNCGPMSLPGTTLFIIMGIHSAIEGLALGIVDSKSGVISLGLAIAGHKPIEAFALGLVLLRDKPVRWMYWCMMAFYILLSPVGTIIAVQIEEHAGGMVIGVLSAVSAGTFLYVAVDEWAYIFTHRSTLDLREKIWHLGLYMLGILWMLLIALAE